jgi:ribosomal protein L7/L12
MFSIINIKFSMKAKDLVEKTPVKFKENVKKAEAEEL